MCKCTYVWTHINMQIHIIQKMYNCACFSVPHCFHTHTQAERKCFMLRHVFNTEKRKEEKNRKLPSYGENYQVKDWKILSKL